MFSFILIFSWKCRNKDFNSCARHILIFRISPRTSSHWDFDFSLKISFIHFKPKLDYIFLKFKRKGKLKVKWCVTNFEIFFNQVECSCSAQQSIIQYNRETFSHFTSRKRRIAHFRKGNNFKRKESTFFLPLLSWQWSIVLVNWW